MTSEHRILLRYFTATVSQLSVELCEVSLPHSLWTTFGPSRGPHQSISHKHCLFRQDSFQCYLPFTSRSFKQSFPFRFLNLCCMFVFYFPPTGSMYFTCLCLRALITSVMLFVLYTVLISGYSMLLDCPIFLCFCLCTELIKSLSLGNNVTSCNIINIIIQQRTNPGPQVATSNKFCTMAPNICGPWI